MVVNNGEMQDGPSSGPPVLGKEAPGVLGRVGWAAGAIRVGREGGRFSQANLVVVYPHRGFHRAGRSPGSVLSGCQSCGEPSTSSAQGSGGGLCSCRTVSGPEPSSPLGSLSSGPALGLPSALCLPSSEEMEDFSRGSGLCHLTILLLLLPLPTGGSTGECVPTPFLCGSPGARPALSTSSGWVFEEPFL